VPVVRGEQRRRHRQRLTSGVYGSTAAGVILIGWSLLNLPLTRVSPRAAHDWIAKRRLGRA
jgi:hypothetical protein